MRHSHHHSHHHHGRNSEGRSSDGRRFAHSEADSGRRGARGEGHHGPRHGGRHGHGGPSRLGRFFEHGDMRFVLLQLIAERPRHGYELIKAIEEKSGGAYVPSPGVIYPTLTLLEETGHVAVADREAPRKLHQITDEGRAYLAANQGIVDAIFARIAATTPAAGEQPPILAAMRNLKRALRQRLSTGPMTEAQISAIASLIDTVAAAVEKQD
jgi:DNA-binding PadR family transcriptional regulator